MKQRVLVASNRGPVSYAFGADGALAGRRGGGGMIAGLMSGLAAVAPGAEATWICAAPLPWPGPTNQMSEPGSPQRTAPRPLPAATSASMAGAMPPLAVTDQPSAVALPLPAGFPAGAVFPAGTVRTESTPRSCGRIGLAARSETPAGGNEVS